VPDDSVVRFRRVVSTALAELERRREEVNDLNVFPVADGDTGDNMAMTMRAVLEELDRINGQPLDEFGRDELVAAVARAALLGARGNSGVILSQIVRGAFQSAYLGYYANADHAGKGLMSEAMELILDLSFGPLALHRLEANIQPGNAPSIALARRAGFRLEGYSPRYLLIGGRWRDHERYAITAEDRRAAR
jgi:hypothetical protein